MTNTTDVDINVECCLRAQTELFAAGRIELADELVTPECVDHTAPRSVPPGPDGIKQVVGWLQSTFGGLDYDIEDAFGSGDRVVLRCAVSGTLEGELAGRQPTGRQFRTAHIHIYRLEDGRIAEHWGVRDDVTMMRQVGLLDGDA